MSLHWFTLNVKDPELKKRIDLRTLRQYNRMAPLFVVIVWLTFFTAIGAAIQERENSPQGLVRAFSAVLTVSGWFICTKVAPHSLTNLVFLPIVNWMGLLMDVLIIGDNLQAFGWHYVPQY